MANLMDNWRLNQLLVMYEDDKTSDFVHFAIAKEYEKLKDINTAIEWYEKLKLLNSNYVGLYYHLAACFVDIDDHENAMSTYTNGIEVAQNINDLHALGELKNAKLNFELEL